MKKLDLLKLKKYEKLTEEIFDNIKDEYSDGKNFSNKVINKDFYDEMVDIFRDMVETMSEYIEKIEEDN